MTNALSSNQALLNWIEEMARLCKPDGIVWIDGTPEQAEALRALQAAFADVCNALAPLVQEHRCWNRVTLHHLAYRGLREQFPAMGSQMICNAIYSVSLSGRMVFQHPASPFHHTKLEGRRLPALRFSPNSPVYFDRHTLSLKGGVLSLYTLEGRMHFRLAIDGREERGLREKKLREVVLSRNAEGRFQLVFDFADARQDAPAARAGTAPAHRGGIPDYLQLEAAT